MEMIIGPSSVFNEIYGKNGLIITTIILNFLLPSFILGHYLLLFFDHIISM